MKKKLLYIAAIIICLSIISGGTFAYFTADEIAHNVITTNQVEVEIITQQKQDGSIENGDNAPIMIMPSKTVSKIVSVKGIEADSWVRINYEIVIYNSEGNEKTISNQELEKIIRIEPDDKNWIEKNGWWYYKSALGAGETAMPLFETISFSGPDMGNEYQNCTIEIDITAQGVQKANNGNSVMEAAGWPEE